MKNYFKTFAVVVVLVVVGSACGGGGGAKVELVPVATELRPTPNGYAFANFPASASPEEFNADDLAKMFGSEACVDGVVAPCDPIAEAAAWARMVNQARASGQCEGMVVEASQRFDLSLSPPTVDLVNEGEVTHEIIRTFATQFLPEVQEETLGWGEKSLAAIVAELVESFKTGKAKYSMGLYIEQGGHAVLPYAVEFPTPDLAVIQLYDSNWPGKNRYVEVDLKANQWRFSFSGKDPANDPAAWTGGQGFMDLTSLDTRGNSTCPFCASETKVKNSMIVISSVDTDWSISNANGIYSPSSNNLVEGIVSRPIRGSVSPSGVKALEYVVFVEGNDMKLDLPNTTSAFISQGSAVVQVSTSGKNSGTVTITKDTVSVDDPNVNVKVASADLVADIAGNNTVIGITEKQLDVSVESSTGQTFTVAVNQETPQVSARVVDASSSSAPTNFVITTQTSDNQVQVREVARDGSETVVTKQASAETDLNNTDIQLAPALQVSTVKPGLPPLEDRDLKNPEYKADESFVPKTGLVVSKLAEVVVLSSPTNVPVKNATVPEVMNSFGPTTLLPVSTTTVPPTSTTTTPTTLPTTTTVKPTTTTVKSTTTTKPVVKTTTTTTTTVPPTTTTSSTTTTTSSTTTTTTTTVPPIISAPSDTTTTTTSTTTTTAPPQESAITFSYNPTTVTQNVRVSTTGKTTLLATARAIGAPDLFYVGIELRGVGGGLIYSHSTGWVTLTNSYQDITLEVEDDDVASWASVDSVTLVLGGDDAEFWAGNYGPKVDSASLKLDGTELISNTEFVDGDRYWTSSVGWQTCSGGAGNAPCPTTGLFGATAPGAPTSVSGTSGNGQVSVSWTAPASNGGAVVTDYIVQYSTSSSGTYTTFSDGASTTTTATVTGLTNNTVYYFKVAAVNYVGTGTDSAVSSGVTPLVPYFNAVSNLTAVANANGSVDLAWSAPTASNLQIYGYSVSFYDLDVIGGTASGGWGVWTNQGTTYSLSTGMFSGSNPVTTGYGPVRFGIKAMSGQCVGVGSGSCTYGPETYVDATVLNPALGTRTLTIDSISYVSSYRKAISVTPPMITSTASAGAGTTTYSSSTTSVCTINSSTGVVAFVSVGTCTIGASIAADSSYNTATASAVSFSVVYAVGDTGPAGGKIFILPTTTGNSTGKYFEAAPTSWNGGADPSVSWCSNNNLEIGSNAQGTALGTGQGNTTAIVAVGKCTSGAAYQARNYNGGGLSDWFLPSEDELKALQAVQVTIGGFAPATYWSSTEIALGRYGALGSPGQEAYPVHFPNGGTNLWYKYQSYYVRPVRMFSPTS